MYASSMPQFNHAQLMQIGLGHHQAGQLEQAESLYRQVLALQPNHFDALHLLGVVHSQKGEFEIAVELLQRAVNLNPNFAQAHCNLGVALKTKGQLDAAVNAFRRAIALMPDNSEALNNLGIALKEKGQVDEAIIAYRQAIALRPGYAEAHYNLAAALKGAGQREQAVRSYRQAAVTFAEIVARRPGFAAGYYCLGNALRESGQGAGAIAAYRQAVTVKPDYCEAYVNLGIVLRTMGRLDEAIAALRRATAIQPTYPEAHYNLGNALKEQEQFDQATVSYRQAINLRPEYVDALHSLGSILAASDRIDEAVVVHRQGMEFDSEEARCAGPTPRYAIIPPYHGEFGCMLLCHIRFVHELRAESKIVCCRRGEELLFPSASAFEYGWKEAGPDSSRGGHGSKGQAPHRPGYEPVDPIYPNLTPWKNFKPIAPHRLPAVDIALGPRQRANPLEAQGDEPSRNWPHWEWLVSELRERGLSIGLVGNPESTQQIQADARAWDHPDGCTAGSIDILSHCRVYVGTDTGPTHLAAFCNTPTVGFRLAGSGPDCMVYAQSMNRSPFKRLPKGAWNEPQAVLHAIIEFLRR